MERRHFLRAGLPASAGVLMASTPARAVPTNNLSRRITVTHFGAEGNGSTDDTSAIQSACNALEDEGCLYFPVGKYRVTKPITLPPRMNVQVIGDGPASILYADAPMSELLRIWRPFHGSIIEQLSLNANNQADTALRLLGGTYVRLTGLDISNPRNLGIHCGETDDSISSGVDLIISDCRLSGLEQPMPSNVDSKTTDGSHMGILVEKGYSFGYFNNVIIRGFVHTGMELRGDENIMHEVHIYRFPAVQFEMALCLHGRHSYVAQCSFDNFANTGIEVLGNNTTIETCYFKRWSAAFGSGKVSPGDAIRLGDDNYPVENINIQGNSFYSEMPDDPLYANTTMTAVRNKNARRISSEHNQYIAVNKNDHIIPGDTAISGAIVIPKGKKGTTVPHGLIATPQQVHLTPASRLDGAEYWVDDINGKEFSISLSQSSKQPVKFYWRI
jgi:hypothetical protein